MDSVGIRELKARTTQLLRRIREKGEPIEVTYRGKVIALLVPALDSTALTNETAAIWTDMDRLAAEIAAHWPADVSATDAVRDVRRDL